MSLPPELEKARREIEAIARDYGLDFFPVVFELVSYKQMHQLAAYTGFPVRYPHWRWGMEYERVRKSYTYGLQVIHEMVINNNPCYAYLLSNNTMLEHKMVMAHVYAHADFFKNNQWFAHTNRKMLDEMANHAVRVQRYIERYGEERVESFIDLCLSIEDMIDFHAAHVKRYPAPDEDESEDPEAPVTTVPRLPSKSYLDKWVNPPEFLEELRQLRQRRRQAQRKFPPRPEKDLLLFLLQHAPLEEWQRDILSIIREESYYFAPQMMTKILNEGWASFWHSKIMTERVLKDEELIDYADRHAAVTAAAPGVLNPYKLGLELLRDIKERWDKGRFGKEYEECDDLALKEAWDKGLGLGMAKLFEVRRVHNDVTFIDAFLTEEFVRKHKLFTYDFNRYTGAYEISSRQFETVKQKLLFLLTNCGRPIIWVVDGNYRNRGELYLWHQHEGVDLRWDYAVETTKNIHALWKRPVHLETVKNGRRIRLSVLDKDRAQEEVL
ncbi:MAG: hypothetical protein PVTTEEND_001741 [Candidatus Fervidibacter sp.]|jgi:Uncharacterized conserved protein